MMVSHANSCHFTVITCCFFLRILRFRSLMEYMPLRLSCLTPQGKNHKMRGFECKIVEDLCIIVPILDISGACTSDRQPGVNDSPMVPPHHQHPPVVEKKAGLPTQEDAMAAKKKLATLQARSFCFLFFFNW